MSEGLFVSLEGIEGCGKTTQARELAAWVEARGHETLLVREPGGTGLSEAVRSLLLRRDGPPVNAWAELCLYEAARAQLVAETIRPALERGAVVIADRFADASVAYQGGGRRLGTVRVRALNRWVTGGLEPRRSFLLDLDPEVGLRRVRAARGTLDRLEGEPLAFHRRVRSAYRRLASREPDRFEILDARRPVEEVASAIRAGVRDLL